MLEKIKGFKKIVFFVDTFGVKDHSSLYLTTKADYIMRIACSMTVRAPTEKETTAEQAVIIKFIPIESDLIKFFANVTLFVDQLTNLAIDSEEAVFKGIFPESEYQYIRANKNLFSVMNKVRWW